MSQVKTLAEFIVERQHEFTYATGELSQLLTSFRLAGKVVNREVNKAGLAEDILGAQGTENVQGEAQQKLDVYANDLFIRLLRSQGMVCAVASEENDDIVHFDNGGKYVVTMDPLDGSSNIDVNVSIGTIFSVHRRVSTGRDGTMKDCLQKGSVQVAAGYIMYGSSIMFVYTTGDGVHGFTLDPVVGEFFLSHENIRMPTRGGLYSINEGNRVNWDPSVAKWVDWIRSKDGSGVRPYGHRYVGTLVADFHRTLLKGGVFAYPADVKNKNGKLRLLYEASPMAFIAEAAGGAASTGKQRILDVEPTELHQRVPLYIGSKDDVDEALKFVNV